MKKAQAVFDTQGASGWQVQMTFNSTGAKKFADITGQLAKNQAPQNEFGIVLDGEVVSSPYVSLAITGGSAYISGHFTQQEAQSLANMLSYGALPLSFQEQSVTTVTAALGGQQLHAGLLAGASASRWSCSTWWSTTAVCRWSPWRPWWSPRSSPT